MLCISASRWFHLVGLVLVSLIAASCGSGDGPASSQDTTTVTLQEYELVWSDEFNEGSAPSVENWNIETGYGVNNSGWGNNEWQLYTDSPDNVRVENGNLVITARCDSGVCGVRDGSITSARINSKDKFEVKYGKIQARIKMPPGKGMWPAFWMLGSNFPERPWPGVGEIDIVEMHQFFSDDKTTHFTVHWSGPLYELNERPVCSSPANDTATESQHCQSEFKKFDQPLTNDFHVYEVEWTENAIVGKIDGIPYFTKAIEPDDVEQYPNGAFVPKYMDEFLNSYFMILNVAVGGTLGGPPAADLEWPQQMLVDWVRVYQKPDPTHLEVLAESADASALGVETVINSAIYGGNSVISDLNSTAVTPLAGNTVMEADYTSANAFFSGAAFALNHKDLSAYDTLTFSLNTTQFPDLASIAVELVDSGDSRVSVPITNYTPAMSGDWMTYEVPLSHYAGVDLQNVVLFGFWNPVDSSNQLTSGTLFLDDILFVANECTTAGSVTFNALEYAASASSATVTVNDPCAASTLVVVTVETGADKIGVGLDLNAAGVGNAAIDFGPTSDALSRIAISEGDMLAVNYTDANEGVQGDAASIVAAGTVSSTLGVFSEINNSTTLPYVQIIDAGVDFGGNPTPVNTTSTAVTPYEGLNVLEAGFIDAGQGYGGFIFNFGAEVFPPNPTVGQDVSAYEKLSFALNSSAMPGFADLIIQIEDGAVAPNMFLSNYTPTFSGDWAVYEIPLADFPGLNTSNLTYLGFWNASSSVGSVTIAAGTLYVDDIHFIVADSGNGDGNGNGDGGSTGDLTIFADEVNSDWIIWDCCGGSTPTVETDDGGRGSVVEFVIGEAPTVMGFSARADVGGAGVTFDASSEVATGTISFDLKVVTPPNDPASTWVFKVESSGAATFAELPLTNSVEGVAPTTGTWQTYTFNLSDLAAAGLDVSAIDVVLVFPAWETGNGAVYRIDNLQIGGEADSTSPPASSGLAIFADEANSDWAIWDCCGGSTPTVATDDGDHGAVVEFMIGEAPTVMGFNARADVGGGGITYDASAATSVSFEMKVVTAPVDPASTWMFKIESAGAATFAELPLTSSLESATPVTGVWQTYTFNISDLTGAGLDTSAVDVVMVFPAWDTGNGAVYRIDNVYIND